MRLLSAPKDLARQVYFRRLIRQAANDFEASDAPGTDALARACRRYLAGDLSADEQRWVDQIEGVRSRLDASDDEVWQDDAGAGPDAAGQGTIRIVGEMCRSSSKPKIWATVLMLLIRESGARNALELGTCFGISGSYLGAALTMNGDGRLTTLEGSAAFVDIARDGWTGLGLTNIEPVVGSFDATLDGVLDAGDPFDFVFIDGHHQEQATLDYFERIAPHMADDAVIIFDDIHWSDGMKRAWARLEADPRITASADLHTIGVCTYRPA